MSKTTVGRNADCVAALSAFLNGNDCDIRSAALPEFIYDFGIFLCRDYDRHYAPATAAECLATLRKYLRMAIAEGYVPNLDATPAVVRRLANEVWHSRINGPKNLDTAQSLGTHADLRQLARSIDSALVKDTMTAAGATDTTTDRQRRDAALLAKSAAIYLFGALNYGLEINETLAIKRDDPYGTTPDSIYVEKYRVRLPLSPAARQLVDIVNRGATPGKHLFAILDNQKYKGDIDRATRLIENRVAKYLYRERLGLYRKHSAFIDWLNLAIENRFPVEHVTTLLKHSITGTYDGDPTSVLLAAQQAIADKTFNLGETWHLMRVISPAVKRDKFVDMLQRSGILGNPTQAKRRIYAPQEWQTDRERGQIPVMSRYVFFRATPIQAELVNRFTPYARVLRQNANGAFIKINEQEIRDLQEMLHDFPDAVELIDRDEWLRRQNAEIVVGCRAIIRSGRLIGKEATVVQIKGSSARPVYLIEYAHGALTFKTTLTGIDLTLLPHP